MHQFTDRLASWLRAHRVDVDAAFLIIAGSCLAPFVAALVGAAAGALA